MTLVLFIFDGALIALGIYLKIKSTVIDGYLGERFVTSRLRKLDPQHYKILTNLLIPSNGKTDTAQIDQIVISTYGIFCIETKAHVGRVYGGKYDKYWNTYKKYRLYNPIRQNYGHIKAIEDVIGMKCRAPINSLVAFPFARQLIIDSTDTVNDTQGTVNKILSYHTPIYNADECMALFNFLKAVNITNSTARRQHIKDIQTLPA